MKTSRGNESSTGVAHNRRPCFRELDAAFFHLYGIGRDDVEYILSTFKGIHQRQPLLAEASSVAQRILEKYDEMSPPG